MSKHTWAKTSPRKSATNVTKLDDIDPVKPEMTFSKTTDKGYNFGIMKLGEQSILTNIDELIGDCPVTLVGQLVTRDADTGRTEWQGEIKIGVKAKKFVFDTLA